MALWVGLYISEKPTEKTSECKCCAVTAVLEY